MRNVKLTKSSVDKLQFDGKILDYMDTELKGFGVRVGKESKSFFARKEVKGKVSKKVIGKLGTWTPDLAREEAKRLLREMDQGIDPREVEKRVRAEARTVEDAFKEYLKHRPLKASTKTSYTMVQNRYLAPWLSRPIAGIGRADVLELHRQLTTGVGAPTANHVMVVFGSVWSYAHVHLENPPMSPTRVLAAAKAWHPKNRRSDRLAFSQIPDFLKALQFLRECRRDAFTLILHTGLRSEEATGLKWADVDLEEKTFTARDTKNGTDHTLPMSAPVCVLFTRRHGASGEDEFVFPGQGRTPKIKLEARTLQHLGFDGLTVHGLRRTFRSFCEALAVPAATTKALMNHSLKADITDSYLSVSVDDMRPWMEGISAEIMRLSSP